MSISIFIALVAALLVCITTVVFSNNYLPFTTAANSLPYIILALIIFLLFVK